MSEEFECDKLKILTAKLRCIGHLIETQDPNHLTPTDFDDVQLGLALFINEIATEMLLISKSLEKKLI